MTARRALSLGYLEGHPDRAAALLERFPAREAATFFENVPPAVAADVVAHMAPLAASACISELLPATRRAVLGSMPVDIASALLRRVPTEVAERLIASLPDTQSNAITGLLRFAERTSGALVDPLVLALPLDVSVNAALQWLRAANPKHVDSDLFVIDREHKLVGVVSLHSLIAAAGEARLETLAEPARVRLAAAASIQVALESPVWMRTRAAPVVDASGVFLGALRYDTARRYAEPASTATPSMALAQTVLGLTELYWMGCGRLTTELVAAMIGGPQSRSAGGAQ